MVGVSRLSKQGMSSGHGAPDSTELPAPLHGAERGQRRPGHHHPDMAGARTGPPLGASSFCLHIRGTRSAFLCLQKSRALPSLPWPCKPAFRCLVSRTQPPGFRSCSFRGPRGTGSKAKDAQAAGWQSLVRSAPAAPVGGASQCLVHARTDSTCGGPFSAADGCSSAASVTGLAVP